MGDEDEPQAFDKSFWEPTAETIEGCAELAFNLFRDIEGRFGEKEARRIFSKCSKPHVVPPHEWKKLQVLVRYKSMKPRPNKLRLAKELSAENKILPKDKRHAKGSTSETSMFKYIDRAVKEDERDNPLLNSLIELDD